MSKPKKKWSFLAYIAGDNNLSDNGLIDISELCKVGSSNNVHAAVQIDTYGEHDGSIRYEINEKEPGEDEAYRTIISRLAESDSGNPVVLKNFLTWGLKRYPADKRLIVIWNHGSGFRSVRRDIGYDDFGSSMDMPEVTEAMTRAGIDENHKIAVLGFDACLMNMVEIAHHFRNHAEVLVGSQQTEPAEGWPYDKVLKAMHEDHTARELGAKIAELYIADYTSHGVADVTQSAIDLAATDAAMGALSKLGRKLADEVATSRAAIRKSRLAAQSFEYADYVDARHLLALLAGNVSAVASEAKEASDKIAATILAAKHYGSNVKHAQGLSVWFPTSNAQYHQFRSKYLQLDFAKNADHQGWVTFLDEYYQA